MFTTATVVGHTIRATAKASPTLAARLALAVFFRTAPRMTVHEHDAATDLAGHRKHLRVRERDVAVYNWGSGDRTVLLMHGWQGRASQFAPLVRELVAEGLRVVAFDAPAHGASDGRHTDIRDWISIAGQLEQRYGGFHAIVGHSFGALAALSAARELTSVRSVTAISGVASAATFLTSFGRMLGFGSATQTAFERLFLARVRRSGPFSIDNFDVAAHPLPAGTELLVVHDREDRQMADTDSLRLHAAHEGRSRMLRTTGFGHTRILAADAVLDAVIAVTTGGLEAVDDLESPAQREMVPEMTDANASPSTSARSAPSPR